MTDKQRVISVRVMYQLSSVCSLLTCTAVRLNGTTQHDTVFHISSKHQNVSLSSIVSELAQRRSLVPGGVPYECKRSQYVCGAEVRHVRQCCSGQQRSSATSQQ